MTKIFISYRKVKPDSEIASYIHRYLEELGYEVFLDKDDIKGGDDWHKKIRENIENSSYFVALVSLSYLNSDYIVKHEFNIAASLLKQGKIKLLQVNLAYDGEPPSAVATIVRSIQFIKWRGREDTPHTAETIASLLPPIEVFIRGMRSYNGYESSIFSQLGRQKEIESCLASIANNKLSYFILHGISGAGKSSFVKAGLIPDLGDRASFFELEDLTSTDLTFLPRSEDAIVFFDQFEQSLRQLANKQILADLFVYSCDSWIKSGHDRKIIFCIRDEYRTAFEVILPTIAQGAGRAPLLPLSSAKAAEVLILLLQTAQVVHNPEFITVLCREKFAEGIPPRILPAILQLVAQYFQNHNLTFDRHNWEAFSSSEQSLFEEHINNALLEKLPGSISKAAALQVLEAMTAGEQRRSYRSVDDIIADQGLSPETINSVMETALLPSARVVMMELDEKQQQPRYRLAHDLFVPAVNGLSNEFRIARRKRRQRIRIASLTALLAAAVLSLLAFYRINRSLSDSRNLEKGRGLLIESAAIRDKSPQASLLLSLEALNYFPADMQTITSAAGRNLMGSLQSMGGIGFEGYTATLRGVSPSSNGKWVVAWSDNETILWKITMGIPRKVVLSKSIYDAAFSLDDNMLITVGKDSMKIWQLGADSVMSIKKITLPDFESESTVTLSNSGILLVAGGYLLLKDKNSFVPLLTIGENDVCRFSADDNKLAISDGYTLELITLDNVANIRIDSLEDGGKGSFRGVQDLKFSHNGQWLMERGEYEDSIRLWSLKNKDYKKPVYIQKDKKADTDPILVDFSGDDKYLVIVNRVDKIEARLIEMSTIKNKRKVLELTLQNESDLNDAGIYDDENKLIAIGDKQLFVWDLNKPFLPPLTSSCNYHMSKIEITDIGQLLTATEEGPVLEWDISDSSLEGPIAERRGNEKPGNFLHASYTGNFVISGHIELGDPSDKTHPTAKGRQPDLRIWKLDDDYALLPRVFETKGLPVSSSGLSGFSPNGKWFLCGDIKFASLWKFDSTGSLSDRRILAGHQNNIHATAIHNNWAAAVGALWKNLTMIYDSTVLLWDLSRKEGPFSLTHRFPVSEISFSGSGNWFIASSDNRAQLWDLRSSLPARPEPVDLGDNLSSMKMSGDERYLCTALNNGEVRIYNISGKTPVLKSIGSKKHEKGIKTIIFSKADDGFYTGSSDGRINFWSIDKGYDQDRSFDLKPDKRPSEIDSVIFDKVRNERWLVYHRNDKWRDRGPSHYYDLIERPDSIMTIAQSGNIQFSNNNKRAIDINGNVITLWDLSGKKILRGGRKFYEPELTADSRLEYLFSPDGKLLVTFIKNKIWIRDLDRNDQPANLLMPSEISSMDPWAISPDNRWMVGRYGIQMAVWPLDFECLKKLALGTVGRTLTPEERQLYNLPPATR